jgi:Flp pilus assembly protein TadD
MRRPAAKSKPAAARATTPVMARPRFPAWPMAVLLALLTITLYWPATRCAFVNYDDGEYVVTNLHVQKGLTLESIKWAFLNPAAGNWHPLTMLSHMLDCQLFGLNPRGHHLTSVLLHALNAVLVFALLQQMTGAAWLSFFAAALFAVHPLRVESVAWISERKDVLSTCLGLLSLIFYARYARKRPPGERPRSQVRAVPAHEPGAAGLDYGLAVFFLALGLTSKPMLVTWPFVMLLLDYWPLDRFKPGSLLRLAAEKIPFFALAMAASVVTFAVQKQAGAMVAWEKIPVAARGENALISYSRYLWKMLWPKDLAVPYPHPGYWPLEKVLLAGALLAGISILLWLKRRRCPFLLMGWLWYCGTLAPVIGLAQVGEQAMADRYAYIPSLGVLILAIWGAYELARHWHSLVIPFSAGGAAGIVLCLGLTRHQLGYWQDSESLFRHATEVTENNYIAHNNLGVALNAKGRIDEAIRHFQEALRVEPDFAEAHGNLGAAFAKKGRIDEAILQFQAAIRLKPNDAGPYNGLGNALDGKGQTDDAIRQYQEALRLKPDFAEAHGNLGAAFGKKGRIDEAILQLREAIRLKPNDAAPHNDLGNALDSKGQTDQAIRQYQEALRVKPDFAEAHANLGAAFDKQGRIDEAILQLREAIRLKPDLADTRHILGVDLGQQGRTDEAILQFQEAIRLKPNDAAPYNDLGNALDSKGQTDQAIRQYQEALRVNADFAQAHANLGAAFGKKGRIAEAIIQLQEAIRLKPDDAYAHYNLGMAFDQKGQTDEAIRQYHDALRLKPDFAQASNNLAQALKLKNSPAGR